MSDGAKAPLILLAAGGTGGHLFPALAVVELLRERGLPVDVSFFCTQRPIDQDVLGKVQVDARPLSVLPFPTRPWTWPRFLWRWRESVAACRRAFEQRRPAVIVGAGGYASGPPVHAGLKMGIPTFLLNPDAVPGRANRHLGRRPDLAGVFAQWDVTRTHFPPTARVHVTGCPVRKAFRAICQFAARLDARSTWTRLVPRCLLPGRPREPGPSMRRSCGWPTGSPQQAGRCST